MTRQKLIKDATAKGLWVRRQSDNGPLLIRGKHGIEIAIYEDGTVHRADVQLNLAKGMTVTAAAKALGL